nr:MAG TPA: hypothetical protein [Caudoviricetes sp.]DAL16655.1 MAG TPA_asm: hypothetical protein [Caudoviricetes sp.]DAT74290.1 MAG TPA: hypothetical protein [Caudoviricetes sp.]
MIRLAKACENAMWVRFLCLERVRCKSLRQKRPSHYRIECW